MYFYLFVFLIFPFMFIGLGCVNVKYECSLLSSYRHFYVSNVTSCFSYTVFTLYLNFVPVNVRFTFPIPIYCITFFIRSKQSDQRAFFIIFFSLFLKIWIYKGIIQPQDIYPVSW